MVNKESLIKRAIINWNNIVDKYEYLTEKNIDDELLTKILLSLSTMQKVDVSSHEYFIEYSYTVRLYNLILEFEYCVNAPDEYYLNFDYVNIVKEVNVTDLDKVCLLLIGEMFENLTCDVKMDELLLGYHTEESVIILNKEILKHRTYIDYLNIVEFRGIFIQYTLITNLHDSEEEIDYSTIKILDNSNFKWIIIIINKYNGMVRNLYDSNTIGCRHDVHDIDKIKIFNSLIEARKRVRKLEKEFISDEYIIEIKRLL